MGRAIPWELCKKLKVKHATKWYMHNSESVLANEAHKLPWDVEIQTDHPISTRWPDLAMVDNYNNKKKTCWIVDIAVPADHRVKLKEIQKGDKYFDLARKIMDHEGNGDTNCNWFAWNNFQRTGKGTGRLRNNRRTIQTTALLKSARIPRRAPETWVDLRRLAVTQTPVENHQLTLVWKTHKMMMIILKRVLETGGDLLSPRLQWNTTC